MSSSSTSGSSSKTMKEKTLNGVGNLIRLLPTGTVFLYQFLNPVLTNNGQCTAANKVLSGTLIGLCGFSCFFSSFTDSYTDTDGITHYGIATFKGFYPSSSSSSSSNSAVDFSSYKLKLGDFVHAFFALIVFGVISLLDTNTMDCFYPSFKSTQKALLMALPPALGTISGTIFFMFPNTRHGIGYPLSQQSSASDSDANRKA